MAKPVRRRDPRLVVNREFRSVEEFIAEYVSNISRSGAFIRTDEPLPVGTRVQLRFTLLLDDIETIEGEGEVVRLVKASGRQRGGMGVVFTSLSAYSKQLIERLVTRRRMAD
jgi:uncharacterized protein (TIGR02266 family)